MLVVYLLGLLLCNSSRLSLTEELHRRQDGCRVRQLSWRPAAQLQESHHSLPPLSLSRAHSIKKGRGLETRLVSPHGLGPKYNCCVTRIRRFELLHGSFTSDALYVANTEVGINARKFYFKCDYMSRKELCACTYNSETDTLYTLLKQ